MAKLKFGSPAWRKKYMKNRLNPRLSDEDYIIRQWEKKQRKLQAQDIRAERAREKREEARYRKAEKAALKKEEAQDRKKRRELMAAVRATRPRSNRPKRKAAQRKRTASHKRGTAAKKSRMKEMIRGNPPKGWINAKQVRVVRKNGRSILEIKR